MDGTLVRAAVSESEEAEDEAASSSSHDSATGLDLRLFSLLRDRVKVSMEASMPGGDNVVSTCENNASTM